MNLAGGQLFRLFLAYYLSHCAHDIYFISGPLLQAAGHSQMVIGWFLSIFFFAQAAARPIGSWGIETFGVRRTLVAGGLIFVASALLIPAAIGTPWALLLLRAIGGGALSAYLVALVAYQSLCVPFEKRGSSFALVAVGGMAPLGTIVPLGEWILSGGHETLYLSIGPLVGLCCVWIGYYIVPAGMKTPPAPPQWGTYRELFASPYVPMLFFSVVLICLVDGTTACMANLKAEHAITVSFFMVPCSLGAVAIRLFGSRLMDRIPRPSIVSASYAAMALSFAAIAFFPRNEVMLVCGLFFGVGIGAAFPSCMSLGADLTHPALQPKAASLVFWGVDLGWGSIPLILGSLGTFMGATASFRLFALFSIPAVVLLHIFYWRPLRARLARKSA